jgi:hypothetical protein
LDNSVPHGQVGKDDELYNRAKAACKLAREAVVKSSKWDGKLLEFVINNATNWELNTIPTELTQWISQDKDWGEAQKYSKWMDLKMLMYPQSA